MKDNNISNISPAMQPDDGRQMLRLQRSRDTLMAGGVFGAVLAVVCCAAPLALVALGVGAAWVVFFTDLERYVLPMIVVTVACFAGGVWFNRKLVRSACADGTCIDDPLRNAPSTK